MIEHQKVVHHRIAKAAAFGASSGFVATWAITILLVASEVEMGFPEGTFYTIIGIVLGMHGSDATYLGFGLHLLTGTLIGVASSPLLAFVTRHGTSLYKCVGMGLGVGFVVWLVLFLPITIFGVQPAMHEIIISVSVTAERMMLAEQIVQMTSVILISAVVYHLVYGAILGYMSGLLIRKIEVVTKV